MTGKNISRTRPFFIANIIAISVGILLVVVMLSLSTAIDSYSRDLIREETSALAIEISINPLSFRTPPLTTENLKNIENHGTVSTVVPLVQGIFAELSHKDGSKTTISLWSTTGKTDPELTRLQWRHGSVDTLKQQQNNYIVVPGKIVEELGVYPASNLLGKRITLTVNRRKEGREEAIPLQLTVIAIVKKTRFFRCYAPLPLLMEIKAWQEWKTHSINSPQASGDNSYHGKRTVESALVYVKKLEHVTPFREILEKKGYSTASILDTVKRYEEISSTITIVLGTIGLIALLAGSLSIFNATYASILRRIKEIGIYKTYGATRSMILSLILAEIAITALAAGAIGYLLGRVVCKVIQDVFLVNSRLDLLQTSFGLFLLAEGLAIVVCILAGLGPALKGARLNPIEAIRHE
jgi:ABC-type lipoprotein release transport system permease subunit